MTALVLDDAPRLEEAPHRALERLLAEADDALDLFRRRMVAEPRGVGTVERGEDTRDVGVGFVLGKPPQRELDLSVGVHVSDAELRCLAAAQGVRLVGR